jgi:hypothetical protein
MEASDDLKRRMFVVMASPIAYQIDDLLEVD